MNQDVILKLAKDTLEVTLMVSGPMLLVCAGGGCSGQHCPGRDFYSGHDTFICSEDYCGFPSFSNIISLDHEHFVGLHVAAFRPSRTICPLEEALHPMHSGTSRRTRRGFS